MAAEPIDAKTASEMTKIGDVVIDVREPHEYAEGHVDGAINIPIGTLPGAELPAGPLITTCTGGRRAERAAGMLNDLGRTAFWIEGGTDAWEATNLPIVTGAEPSRRLRDRFGPVAAVADGVVAAAEGVASAAGTVAAKAETVTEKVVDKLKPQR